MRELVPATDMPHIQCRFVVRLWFREIAKHRVVAKRGARAADHGGIVELVLEWAVSSAHGQAIEDLLHLIV